MEINTEMISDLKGLINILNDGKERYASSAEVLGNYAVHTDHMVLLQRQRTGILDALGEIETYHHRLGV